VAATLAQQAAELLNLSLTPEQEELFAIYARELAAWNTHTNLTAITEPEAVQVRHFLDSLTIAQAVPLASGCRIIDVGSGAGFPGLPLGIVFPHMNVALLEATGKKVAFLNHIIATLGLKNVHTVQARAEEAGQMPEHRAAYDVVVARAVARLPALAEYLLPLTKVGGHAIAMKGKTAEEEANDAERAIAILGGRLQTIHNIQLPGVEETHYLVVIEKIAPTPAAYPRKPGTPTNKPLI
jgi:16S rRNA (guanine527-N7)-methyltransferase